MATWRLVTRPSSKLKNLGDIWSLVRASSQRSRSSSIMNKLFIAFPFFFSCRWFSRNPISRARTRTSCNILMPLGFICYLRNHFIRSLIRRKKCVYVAFLKNLFLLFWHLFIYFFIYLFIFICLFILHPGHNHPQPNFSSTPHPSPPLPYPPREGQVSHENQWNMAYQVAPGLCTFPCIKDSQGKPLWGVGSQMPVKESETAPVPTVQSPERQSTQL